MSVVWFWFEYFGAFDVFAVSLHTLHPEYALAFLLQLKEQRRISNVKILTQTKITMILANYKYSLRCKYMSNMDYHLFKTKCLHFLCFYNIIITCQFKNLVSKRKNTYRKISPDSEIHSRKHQVATKPLVVKYALCVRQ